MKKTKNSMTGYVKKETMILVAVTALVAGFFGGVVYSSFKAGKMQAGQGSISRERSVADQGSTAALTDQIEAWSDDAIMQDYLAGQMTHILQPMEAYIRARIEAGDFCPVDPVLATQMVWGMLFAPIVPVLRGAAPPPSPEQRRLYAETAITILLDGIRVRREK